jgi:hypothetical protein
MQQEDLLGKVDHLLQKPLSGSHLNYLRWVRGKVQKGDIVDFDRDYVLYLWDEFGPSAAATKQSEAQASEAPINPQRANDNLRTRDAARATEQAPPTPATLEAELEKAKQTITRLRDTGKRAVAQRDHWEAIAKRLEQELADLQRSPQRSDRKFEEAKRAFAKLYHPNASVSLGPLEKMVRSEIFKEFWAELERIESQNLTTLGILGGKICLREFTPLIVPNCALHTK